MNPRKDVCIICGSDGIRAKAWVNLNTYKFYDWDRDCKRAWCQECGEEVYTIDEKEYNKDKNKDMIL